MTKPIPWAGLMFTDAGWSEPQALDFVFANSIPEPISGCWLWLGPFKANGEPVFLFRSKKIHARPLALMAATGQRPDSRKKSLSRCHNQRCVNPDHHYYAQGRRRHPAFNVWIGMINRCSSPENTNYPRYGGRGISVCARWRESFAFFVADMGPRPSIDHSIERKDVNGNYEPSNCVWLPKNLQGRNQRRNIWVTFEGKRMRMWEAHEISGLSDTAILRRARLGLPLNYPKGAHVAKGEARQ